jgi:hypothetical protein
LTSSFASTGSSTTTSCSGGGEKNIKKWLKIKMI